MSVPWARTAVRLATEHARPAAPAAMQCQHHCDTPIAVQCHHHYDPAAIRCDATIAMTPCAAVQCHHCCDSPLLQCHHHYEPAAIQCNAIPPSLCPPAAVQRHNCCDPPRAAEQCHCHCDLSVLQSSATVAVTISCLSQQSCEHSCGSAFSRFCSHSTP